MSVKSFNDECLDLDKSLSLKSGSEESLLCEDDEDSLSQQLLDALTPAALSQLRRAFRKARDGGKSLDIDRRVEEVMRAAAAQEGIEFAAPAQHAARCLDQQGFVAAVNRIFGSHKFSPHAHALFQRLDAWGCGRVWWSQLLDSLLAGAPARWTPLRESRVKTLPHCKRETIVKFVPIETRDSFCYAVVTKGGRVGLYDGHLKLLHSYEVFFDRTGVHKRVKNCWITDAVYMSEIQSLVLSASDRSLTLYDAATLAHVLSYCITGLPHIPTCLAYSPPSSRGPAELALGTARGDITFMRFLQRRVLLPAKGDHVNCYFWMELSSPLHKSYCTISTWRRVHARAVRRICYSGDVVFSCSHDSGVSVRARHAPGKLDDYVFKVQRGVSCFHVVPTLHLLATGSADGAVRLWDTTQSAPFAKLAAPGQVAVMDVKVIADMEIVMALCSNCWLHIWDLNEECLLQTIKIKFPFLGVLGKKPDFGAYCIHPGPALQKTVEDEQSPSTSRGSSVVRARSGLQRGGGGGDTSFSLGHRNAVLVSCWWCACAVWLSPPAAPVLPPKTAAARAAPPPGTCPTLSFSLGHRNAVLVSCWWCACAVWLSPPAAPRAPPQDCRSARRPTTWDLPDPVPDPEPAIPPQATPPRAPSPPRPPKPQAIPEDLEKLLENAGLNGILEKDFVLMKGLKHDLNLKLAEMDTNREAMLSAVAAGAPYLALRTYEVEPLAPVDEMTDAYARAMRLLPPSSTAGTPTGSAGSTPRRSRTSRNSSKT
ncbi:uncharacterized protein [Choristoneura fumiferana]|uniref:uncharacterized protein n=1 Tax=Choristoneura fumiferana TaxID=7141 RepID=UPI003D154558